MVFGVNARWEAFEGSTRSLVSLEGTGSPYSDFQDDDYLDVGGIRSEQILDQEAMEITHRLLDEGDLCCKKIRMLMIVPRTNTRPIEEKC